MAENDYIRGTMDIDAQKSTYEGVMHFSARWGVPLALGLAAFFTSLLLGAGLGAFGVFALVVIVVHVIVRAFFSH